MTKNLIIFGAGASYGSGETLFGWNNNPKKKKPPLGLQLFAELQEFDPSGWGKLEKEHAQLFEREGFEKGMEGLSAKKPHDVSLLLRFMAKYFFNFSPTVNNLYYRLAHRIKKSSWKGAIATLNYERLLELSLSHNGLHPVCNRAPKNLNELEICLPHGGCHLFCESAKGIAGSVFMDLNSVKTNGEIRAFSNPEDFFERIKNEAFPPVMCNYNPSKEMTSGANFIEDQRKRFADLAQEANNIAIIGVRFVMHDTHIWEPLKNTKAKLTYCSGSRGGEEFENWRKNNRVGKNDLVLPKYFNEVFDELCQSVNIQF